MFSHSHQKPKLLKYSLLALILILNFFLYNTVLGIGFGLFFTGFTGILLANLLAEKRSSLPVLALGIFSGITSLFVGVRANGFVQGFTVLFSLGVIGILFLKLAFENNYWKDSNSFIKAPFLYFLSLLKNAISLPVRVLSGDKQESKSSLSWIKTGVIALVFFTIFLFLLSSADPVFDSLVKELKNQLVGRSFASLFLAFALFMFITVFVPTGEKAKEKFVLITRRDTFWASVAVVALLAVFIIIQIKYLFGGHSDLSSFGLTYSQYVRKGFIELLLASFIGCVLVYLGISTAKDGEKESAKSKLLNTILLLELFMLLASALKRDLMYVDVYGLTRTRIIGYAIIVWLSGSLFSLSALNLFTKVKQSHLFLSVGALTAFLLGYFNFINTDKIIATQIPQRDGRTDYFYINNLSEDAVDGWLFSVPALQSSAVGLISKENLSNEEKVELANTKLALISLKERIEKLNKKYGPWNELEKEELDPKLFCVDVKQCPTCESACDSATYNSLKPWERQNYDQKKRELLHLRSWRSFNFSEQKAYSKLTENGQFLEDINTALATIHNYQTDKQLSLLEEENSILHDFEYPFVNINLKYNPYDNYQYEEQEELPPQLLDTIMIPQGGAL